MAKRLLLVRHGRVAANFIRNLIGATDVPLDSSSEGPARTLADRVRRREPLVSYCSPMKRCRQMAQAMVPDLLLRFDSDL